MKKCSYIIILLLSTFSILFGRDKQPSIDEAEKKSSH